MYLVSKENDHVTTHKVNHCVVSFKVRVDFTSWRMHALLQGVLQEKILFVAFEMRRIIGSAFSIQWNK